MENTKNRWEVHTFPSPVYECQGKNCRKKRVSGHVALLLERGRKTMMQAGAALLACPRMNVETAELVTLAEAFIETLQDKTEASQDELVR